MDRREWVAGQFEEHRSRLRAVAYRMLGSMSEAEDAIQEAWLRLSRTDTSAIDNLGAWLTTVVGRVSLNMLRARKARREESLEEFAPDLIADRTGSADPEHEAILADSVGLALLVVLETLTPAAREGDFAALVAVLDPDVVLRADFGPLAGGLRVVRGAEAVASQALTYSRLGLSMHQALIDGTLRLVGMRDERPYSVGGFTVRDGKIVEIDILADPERLRQLDLTILDNQGQ